MPRFMMMVGIPASGKSSFAELLAGEHNAILLSSDVVGKELHGEDNERNNEEVFALMFERTVEALMQGKSVVYDATNINRNRRIGLLQRLNKTFKSTSTWKFVYYINTPIEVALLNNGLRGKPVPPFVIERSYKSLNVPIKEEGWDDVFIIQHEDTTFDIQDRRDIMKIVQNGGTHEEIMTGLMGYFPEFLSMYNMPQDSKYHSFSVSRHVYHVYKYIFDNFTNRSEYDRLVMLWTALLHDIGKPYCKNFESRDGEETRYANFISHENVGAQMAISILTKAVHNDKFTLEVSKLIQFHMTLLNAGEKGQKRLRRLVGDETYEMLEFLRDADTLAH
ncbi:TPA: AAA family ATPase [Bacillus cereus]|nr:AAA family ATPase [Bacillus cereus]